MEPEKLRYEVDRNKLTVKLSLIFMGLSVVFRFFGYWGFWGARDTAFICTQILLPILCNILFIVTVWLLGKKFFALTSFSVILGVAFFIIKSLGFGSWIHTVLCIILYLAVAFIYTATVFGLIKTKWLLIPLFGLPLLYHVFVDDLDTLLANENAMSLGEWLPEISVLCIMASLLFISIAMKKRVPEQLPVPDAAPSDPAVPHENRADPDALDPTGGTK